MFDERLLAAAQRVLDGDDSANTVGELEGVLLDDYPGDERFDELLEACALYAPGMGSPYIGRRELAEAIRRAIKTVQAE